MLGVLIIEEPEERGAEVREGAELEVRMIEPELRGVELWEGEDDVLTDEPDERGVEL